MTKIRKCNSFDFVYLDVVPPIHEIVNTLDKPLSRQSYGFLTYQNVPWKLKVRKEVHDCFLIINKETIEFYLRYFLRLKHLINHY